MQRDTFPTDAKRHQQMRPWQQGTDLSEPLAIILDFDKTLTMTDIGESIVEHFGSPGWEHGIDRFRSGEYGIRELWAYEISHLPGERIPEMTAYSLEIAKLRAGLPEFLEYAETSGIPVEVASNGMDFYVYGILAANGMGNLRSAAPGIANGPDGRPRLTFADGHVQCPRTGLCKCDRVWRHRRSGRKVAYVGDGISDFCVAEQADMVFARDSLARHCSRSGIPFTPFENFFEVLAALKAAGN